MNTACVMSLRLMRVLHLTQGGRINQPDMTLHQPRKRRLRSVAGKIMAAVRGLGIVNIL